MKKSLIFLLIWVPLICFVAYKYLPKNSFDIGKFDKPEWMEKIFHSKEDQKEETNYGTYEKYKQDGGTTWIRSEYCYNQAALEDAYRNGTRDATDDIVKNLIHEMEATITYNGEKYKVTLKKESSNVNRNYVGLNSGVGDDILVGDPNSETDGTSPSGNAGKIQ